MSSITSNTSSTTSSVPLFSIERLYVKSLTFDVPNAPAIFLEREEQQIEMNLLTESREIVDGFFDVTLSVTVTSQLPDKRTVFEVKVAQCGIFQILNVPTHDLDSVIGVGCASILFPYAREVISNAVTRSGFHPVVLAPINFEEVFNRNNKVEGVSE